MSSDIYNCIPCKYSTPKKNIYEKHLNRESHIERMNAIKDKEPCVCGKYYKGIAAHQKVCEVYIKTHAQSQNITTNHSTSASSTSASSTSASSTSASSTSASNKDLPLPVNNALYERVSSDFRKYLFNEQSEKDIQEAISNVKDNKNTTVTTIVDENGNTIVEKTTYTTTNSITDYDVHMDSTEFANMVNNSLAALKQTGDRKAFVHNFFEFIFRHVTDIRHTIGSDTA